MVIEGSGGLRGGAIDSHGDHRIAMLGAVAGLASREGVEVHGMEAAAVSYPGFESRPSLPHPPLSIVSTLLVPIGAKILETTVNTLPAW